MKSEAKGCSEIFLAVCLDLYSLLLLDTLIGFSMASLA